jgi:hypothetical protein
VTPDPSSQAAASPPAWWRDPPPALASLALFALAFLAYANTFHHGFVWDDPVLLDQKVRFYRGPLDAWAEPAGLPNMRMYRPLEMMSLWIDRQVWSTSGGFHVTQVMLHAVNAVLVWLLIRRLGAAAWPALAAAALFALHPVQVESVAWITCRADVMTCTFAVLTVLAFLRYLDRPRRWLLPVLVVGAFLATASKETGSVTPFLALAVLWAIARPYPSFTARLRHAWPALVATVVGVVCCQMLRPADVTTGVGRAAFTWQDALNIVGAFSYQLERVLVPRGFAPYVARTPTGAGHIALAMLGGGMLALALALRPRDGGLRRLGSAWFLVAVAPAVAVVLADFSSTPVAERRLYLGMVGVALVVASLLDRYRGRVVSLAVLAILIACGAVTVTRNRYWHDELTLWTAVTERMQTESLPYLNLGLALASDNRPTEAEAAYRRALALDPPDVTRQRTSIDLGLLLADRGDLDEAERLFTAANAIGPHAIAFRGLGMVARKRAHTALRAGDVATASAELNRANGFLREALAINPRYYQASLTLAGVLYDAGQYRAAVAQYQRVVELAGDTEIGKQAASDAQELGAWVAAHPEVQ